MNKPNFLNITEIGKAREKYERNKEALQDILDLIMTGMYSEIVEETGEEVWNRTLTEFVVQQEYIRYRESQNWGIKTRES